MYVLTWLKLAMSLVGIEEMQACINRIKVVSMKICHSCGLKDVMIYAVSKDSQTNESLLVVRVIYGYGSKQHRGCKEVLVRQIRRPQKQDHIPHP
jgi:hypothetical protein